jgi:hypothetical protein
MLLLASRVFFFLNLIFLHNLVLSIFCKIIQSKLYGCTKKGKGELRQKKKPTVSSIFHFSYVFYTLTKSLAAFFFMFSTLGFVSVVFYGIDILIHVLLIFLLICLTPKLYRCKNRVLLYFFTKVWGNNLIKHILQQFNIHHLLGLNDHNKHLLELSRYFGSHLSMTVEVFFLTRRLKQMM